jgi:phosphoribosylformylglycinamidine synthase
MELPIAHREGRFTCRAEWILHGLQQTGQTVLRYADPSGGNPTYPANPTGSQGDVAGLCDASGRVLGLLPHPERHILATQHPQRAGRSTLPEGDGFKLFRNAVGVFL